MTVINSDGTVRIASESVDRSFVGLCVSWANYTPDTIIHGSLNTSSIIDNGTGLFTGNFTNNMASTGFSTIIEGEQNDSGSQNICTSLLGGDALTISSYKTVSQLAQGGGNIDRALYCSQVMGDLA